MPTENIFKIILAGDWAVGKTSIKNRYLGKGFTGEYQNTIGTDFSIKQLNNDILNIWDLAGQPQFKNIRSNFYTGANGVLLVCDVSKLESLHNLRSWISEIELNNGTMVPSIILANKIDLLKEHNEVKMKIREVQEDLQEIHNFKFPVIFTSALTNQNIDYAFVSLLNEINAHFGY